MFGRSDSYYRWGRAGNVKIGSHFVCVLVSLIWTTCENFKSFGAFPDVALFRFSDHNIQYKRNSEKKSPNRNIIWIVSSFEVSYYVTIGTVLIPEKSITEVLILNSVSLANPPNDNLWVIFLKHYSDLQVKSNFFLKLGELRIYVSC